MRSTHSVLPVRINNTEAEEEEEEDHEEEAFDDEEEEEPKKESTEKKRNNGKKQAKGQSGALGKHKQGEVEMPNEMYFGKTHVKNRINLDEGGDFCDFCGDSSHYGGCNRYGPSVRSLCHLCININGTGQPLYHEESICRFHKSSGYKTPNERRSPETEKRHGFNPDKTPFIPTAK